MWQVRHPKVRSRTGRGIGRGALLVLAVTLGAAVQASAASPVPRGFVGVNIDGLTAPGSPVRSEFPIMVKSGVESVRVPFHWVDGQPYRRFEDVPPAQRLAFRDVRGVPTNYGRFDRLVRAAALRRIRVRPVLTVAPSWAAKYPGKQGSPPAGTARFAAYASALVERYGPRGSFWRENPWIPRVPIREWQLWNEPNLHLLWSDPDWGPGYVALVRAARVAIKRVDRRARIVLAGLVGRSWTDLRTVYRQPGARRLFDIMAIHPYTREPSGVLEIARRVRATMKRHGDRRKPLAITEFGWPSSRGRTMQFGFETTKAGQAVRVARTLRLLGRARKRLRLSSVHLYTWLGEDQPSLASFAHAGLRSVTRSGVVSKPALASFRRAANTLKRCRGSRGHATRCANRRR